MRHLAILTLSGFVIAIAGTSFAGNYPRKVQLDDYAREAPKVLPVKGADLPDQYDLTSSVVVGLLAVGGFVIAGAAVVLVTELYHHHWGAIEEAPLAERTVGPAIDILFDPPVR